MGAGDTNEAIQMFDLLLEFLADGAHWTRGHYHNGDGRCCLIGAFVTCVAGTTSRATRRCIYFKRQCLVGVLGLSLQ